MIRRRRLQARCLSGLGYMSNEYSKILKRLKALKEARTDLRYLLDRGYSKASALKLVGDKYQLNKIERSVLFRSVFSKKDVDVIKSKRADPSELRGDEIWIDGFNVLNTVEAILRGDYLILCDDHVLRDFSEIHSKYRLSEFTRKALEEIMKFMRKSEVRRVVILFESQISRSGEIAAMAREVMKAEKISGEAKTSKTVDSDLIKSGKIIASSDSAVLLKCRKFIDLTGHLELVKKAKIITLFS